MIFAALLLALADPGGLAGFYHSNQMEIGAGLLLSPDGHFRYQLDYGAVSEAAEGRWTVKDGAVLLTSTRFVGAWKQRRFRAEPLGRDGGTLVLQRYDRLIRFDREPAPAGSGH